MSVQACTVSILFRLITHQLKRIMVLSHAHPYRTVGGATSTKQCAMRLYTWSQHTTENTQSANKFKEKAYSQIY